MSTNGRTATERVDGEKVAADSPRFAVAGALFRLDVRPSLGLQVPFEGFGVLFTCGLGTAEKTPSAEPEVIPVYGLLDSLKTEIWEPP